MKKFRYLVATLMIAAIVAVVLVGCKKEKSNETQSNNGDATEEVVRKPIATRDMKTGKVTYSFSIDELQKVLNESSLLKGENERYILESLEIANINSKDSEKDNVLFTMIDTETEKSYKTCLNEGFLEKVLVGDSMLFYIPEDVLCGSFAFVDARDDGFYEFTLDNFEVVSFEIIPDSIMVTKPRPKVIVTCDSDGCHQGECIIMYDSNGNPYDCTNYMPPCKCHKIITNDGGGGGNGATWLGIALTIIFGVLPLLV